MRSNVIILFIGITCFYSISCSRQKNKVTKTDDVDSLFLGIHFGMEKKNFFEHCWEYNRRKIFTHGPTNQSVEYKITDEMSDPVMMRFYPSFHNDRIFEVPVVFTYEAWAPWNKRYSADSLLVNLLPVMEKWYGRGFKATNHKTMGTIYYKMDGKRRINLFKRDDQFVQAVFTDMAIKELIKEESNKDSQEK